MRTSFFKSLYPAVLATFVIQLILISFAPFTSATDVGVTVLETPLSITIAPSSAQKNIGETQQFTATANYTGGGTLDVTNNPLTTWSSTSPAIATVTTLGLATGVSAGTTNITATYGGVSGSGQLNVISTTTPPTTGGGGGGGGQVQPGDQSGGDQTGEQPGDQTGEQPGDQTGEQPGDQTGEQPGDQTGEQPGDQTGEQLPPSQGETSTVPPATQDTTPPPAPGPPPPGEEEFSPEPETPEFQFVTPLVLEEVQHEIMESIFLPDALSVTRGEILVEMNEQFQLDKTYADVLADCASNVRGCLSIFLSATNFQGVILDGLVAENSFLAMVLQPAHAQDVFNFGNLQLYPDVPPENPYSYIINIGTILGIVQGYYAEPDSPFKSYQVITRVEATKVLLGSVGMMEWLYYPELEALLGGPQEVLDQTTPFNDIQPSRDYMWWYPRYVNRACEARMFDCTEGSDFRPDDFITENEMRAMIVNLKAYLDDSQYLEDYTADDDNDQLKNYIEKTVTFTDPQANDTDDDQLEDGDEVKLYKTSPFLSDSDGEGLSDYDEVIVYKTDPLKSDTDDDDFTDYSEILAGSDPLDPNSVPVDDNENGVDDQWETRYNLNVVNGIQDSDFDGVSDKLEYQYGTDPLSVDSDGDGLTDAEEILEYGSNPLDPDDPGDLDSLGVRITSFQENQLVGDTTPLIRGVAPFGTQVRLLLRNDFGHEKVLGTVGVDENNVFVFQVEDPLRDGRYMLVARSLQPEDKRYVDSRPVHIIIDSTLNVTRPIPRKLDEEEISDDVLLQNLKITIKNNRPVLTGETEFGNRVTATWRSVVTSSVLIADAVTGEFEIQAPRNLEFGDHEVWVTAIRKNDSAQSESVRVTFQVGAAALGEGIDGVLRGSPEEVANNQMGIYSLPVLGGVAQFVAEQGFLGWLLVAVVLFLIGSLIYYFKLKNSKG